MLYSVEIGRIIYESFKVEFKGAHEWEAAKKSVPSRKIDLFSTDSKCCDVFENNINVHFEDNVVWLKMSYYIIIIYCTF